MDNFHKPWMYGPAADYNSPLGYKRVYLPLYKVADTPFHIQGAYVVDETGLMAAYFISRLGGTTKPERHSFAATFSYVAYNCDLLLDLLSFAAYDPSAAGVVKRYRPMAISTNPNPKIYSSLYEKTVPAIPSE